MPIKLDGSTGVITSTSSLTTGSVLFAGAGGGAIQDNANFFWDDTNNRLGVGTATPSYTLDIRGPIISTTATTADATIGVVNSFASFYLIQQSDKVNFYTGAAQPFVFTTGNTPRMTLDASGNLGIGGSPTGKLDVLSATGIPYVNISTSAAGNASVLSLLAGSGGEEAICYKNALRFGQVTGLNASGFSEKMRIHGNGYVGIGTTPSVNLHIYEANTSVVATELLRLDNPSSNATNNGASLGIYQGGTQYGRIRARYSASTGWMLNIGAGPTDDITIRNDTGNVGIGTPSPTGKLSVNGYMNDLSIQGNGEGVQFKRGDGNSFDIFIGTPTSGTGSTLGLVYRSNYHVWKNVNNTAEYARIDASGNLLVGKTATVETTVGWNISGNGAGNCKIASGQYFVWNRDEDNIIVNFRRSNTSVGTISVTTTATAYNTSSDISLKENVSNSPSALASILSLPIRQFDWKADGSHTNYGWVAQEANEHIPEAITQGDLWQADYGRITPRLIKAFQELAAKVQALEAKEV